MSSFIMSSRNDNIPPLPEDYLSRHYKVGLFNALTDVAGVCVGHVTVYEGDDIRTGATAILPHSGNIFQNKVPAGFSVFNGYGKFVGSVQVEELGELETPILLTNTLATGRAIEALIEYTLQGEGNGNATSINSVVGETNDSRLNNIRLHRPTVNEMLEALANAKPGPFDEGCVGAGTGTVAFGLKGGIGTSSRLVDIFDKTYTIGLLVQSNFGGRLSILPKTVPDFNADEILPNCWEEKTDKDGSIMMIVATDAPLCSRQLKRLANRTVGGLALSGAALSNGSGDFALAFSTAKELRTGGENSSRIKNMPHLPDSALSPMFEAVIEATEESILRSLWMAHDTNGINAKTMEPSRFLSLRTLIGQN
ncbi:P1 family peptidase [uncultured Bartonella sp.]|uniref:DmpA family aminopeptidase n=1 Tax=uncultured Bartonella sp. TaxID=104108 RepID=UPI0026019CD2|nr:P1 family peptidase [uncultured Bartonella sp.]